MNIQIVSSSKIKDQNIVSLEAEYIKRLTKYCTLKISSLDLDESDSKKYAEVLLKAVFKIKKDRDLLIILDEEGKKFSSIKLASTLENYISHGRSSFIFFIGAAHGIPNEIKAIADLSISLSDLTFPYQLAHLVLVEQIYRALTIIKGENYHK